MSPPVVPHLLQRRRSSRNKQPSRRTAGTESPQNEVSSSDARKRKRTGSDLHYNASEPALRSEPVSSTASSVVGFSPSVKREIENLCGGEDDCWHCGARNTKNAHVIGRRQRGNGLPLCPNCHKAFDNDSDLGWVFFPSDLKFFMDFEEKDYARRLEEIKQKKTSKLPIRRCPSIAAYLEHQQAVLPAGARGGLYKAIVLYSYQSPRWPVEPGPSPYLEEPKAWHGDPMIAIDKARRAFGFFPSLLPDMLWKLHVAYDAHDRHTLPDQESLVEAGNSDGSDSSDAPYNEKVNKNRKSPLRNSNPTTGTNKVGSSQQQAATRAKPDKQSLHQKRTEQIMSWQKNGNGLADENAIPVWPKVERSLWAYGPESSAQEAMNFKMDVLNIPHATSPAASVLSPHDPRSPSASTRTRKAETRVVANTKQTRRQNRKPTLLQKRKRPRSPSLESRGALMQLRNSKRVKKATEDSTHQSPARVSLS
ncbi:MAG: hypothetical protein Q9216_001514 [Gyalolechia sp. 2 TL-2023]